RMLERKSGRIINVSSVGGRITLPYFGVYNSTKYAVESLSDALRYELRPFGIDVSLIEPGVIRTNFEATAVANLGTVQHGAYAASLGKYEKMSKMADRFASNPIVIAKAISRAVRARRPAARYVAPRSTNFILFFRAVAPTRMWDWTMRKIGFLSPKLLDLDATKPAEIVVPQSRRSQSDLRAPAN
ncbi:MAG: SDR family NAD(P)-dependent oxidoreductase, partial [Deltaproteobacteria bacterium]|nr:SDR family NAD(P)-dependent oxidoreductase [Deltaproteobacteria bacterium]